MLSMGTSLPSSVHWLYGSPSLKDSVYNHRPTVSPAPRTQSGQGNGGWWGAANSPWERQRLLVLHLTTIY